jgi:SNF2 family DNA or RNA helicase
MTKPKIKIERWGDDRIAAVIPFAFGKDARKRVPGSNPIWDRTVFPERFRFWSYPCTMYTCRRFREEFGNDLDIGPELTEWAWDNRRTEESLEELRAGGADVDLPVVRADAPELWNALLARPYQIEGAAFIVKGKNVCLGDEPRLGKTYQALAAVVESASESVLIACPRTAVRSVWYRKIKELIGEEAFVAQGDHATRANIIEQFHRTPGPRFLIINKEMMRIRRMYRCKLREDEADEWVKVKGHRNPVPKIKGVVGWPERAQRPGHKGGCYKSHRHDSIEYPEFPGLFSKPFDMIILDESHHALATTKHVISANISQIRLGAMNLPLATDGIKVASSGTPFRSSNLKAWGTLNWLRKDVFSSFWRFAEEHWGTTPTGFQGAKVIGKKLKDEDKFRDALRPYYLARTKAQVAPHLKPIEYAGSHPPGHPDGPVGVYLDMVTESGTLTRQGKAYKQMEEMGLATLANGKRLTANGVLAELTRLKQFSSAYGTWRMNTFYPDAPSVKLEWILDFLAEREALDGKVVIATQFTKFAKFYAKRIRAAGWEVVTITGETTDQRRLDVQDLFMQPDGPRVCIINMFAGGEAIDLSSADEMIICDEPWSAHIIEQTENRIQNLAKRQQLTVYRLRAAGTIEQDIAGMTSEQLADLLAGKPEALDELIEARDARLKEAS